MPKIRLWAITCQFMLRRLDSFRTQISFSGMLTIEHIPAVPLFHNSFVL